MGRQIASRVACCSALAIVIASQSAIAQTTNNGQSGQATEQADSVIVVTAQGRTQQLQDVPIAINAVEGQVFQERVITNLETLIPQLPSVTVAESPFQKTVAIRGLGSTGGNIGYEQAAPLFVDGVFGGRGGQFVLPFFDLARVEVVRGPQAIFFGKNATAGAISIVSARPTANFFGSLNAGYDVQNDGYLGEAVLSGPLSNDVRARLAAHYSHRGDYLFDTSANRAAGGAREFGIRGGLEWDAAPNLSFYLKGEYADRRGDRRFQAVCANPAFTQIVLPPPLAAAFGGPVECREDQNLSSGAATGLFAAAYPPGSNYESSNSLNFVLQSNLTLGEHKLEFTSGYSGFDSANQDGLSRTSIGVATSTTQEKFDQYSQEVRLLSPTGGAIEYVLGGLYIHARHRVNQTISQAIPTLVGDYVAVDQRSDAYSAFGRVTWNFADNARISVGGRFTHETKDYASQVNRYLSPAVIAGLRFTAVPPSPAATFNLNLRRSESSFDPSVTAEWNATSRLLFYASVARGTKAGGFEFFPRALVPATPIQLVLPAAVEYQNERALNYETGFKWTFGSGFGQLNGSVFYNDLSDLQNQILNIANLGFQAFNAQEAHSAGFELEGFVRPVEQLRLGGAISYLDATYDRFEFPAQGVNFTGNRLPFAPRWSGNAYLDGNFDLANDLEMRTHFQVNYTGSMSFDASNNPADNGRPYATFDARLAFGIPSQNLELSVNARNLFDKDNIRLFSNPTILSLNLPSNPRGILLAEGRTIFLSIRKEF